MNLLRFGVPENHIAAGASKGTLKLQSLPGCAVSPWMSPKKAHVGDELTTQISRPIIRAQ